MYIRYMDDWGNLAKTRGEFKKAIREMRKVLAFLKVETHPDKTEMGKIEKGFSFLGYQIERRKVSISIESLHRHRTKYRLLLEQGADLGQRWQYLIRFCNWTRVGTSKWALPYDWEKEIVQCLLWAFVFELHPFWPQGLGQ